MEMDDNSAHNNSKYDNPKNTHEKYQILQRDSSSKPKQVIAKISGLDKLELVEDPLDKKSKINEVINRVELNLMDEDDMNSMNSDSIQQSAVNTIDEVSKFVLKQQLKHDLEKRSIGNYM